MAKYYVGERLVNDDGDIDEGIPVIDETGQEIYVLPENFESEGMPGADAMRWAPHQEESGL